MCLLTVLHDMCWYVFHLDARSGAGRGGFGTAATLCNYHCKKGRYSLAHLFLENILDKEYP